jgi:peptidoglycan-N-acetylglucosamine deacetylase
MTIAHALTFDIEDWFHLGLPVTDDPSEWDSLPSLVERRTDDILRICESARVRATFFVLGWVAERRPGLVRRLLDAGHEVGSHSYWHRDVSHMTPDEFRDDLVASLDVLRAQGAEVAGYRAPYFSVRPDADWVFETLAEESIRYDASLVRTFRPNSGRHRAGPHWVGTHDGSRIAELPMSTVDVHAGPLRAGVRYSGGGYLRLAPLRLVSYAIRHEAAKGRGTVVYLHPRDLAPDCPRVPMPFVWKLRTYVGLRTTERKLAALLRAYPFTTCAEVLDEALGSPSALAAAC